MESDDEVLTRLASGGSMEYSTWPILLSTIVSRIEKIAVTEFPTPVLPPPPKPRSPIAEPQLLAPLPSSDPIEPPSDITAAEDGSSEDTNKENTNPAPPPRAPPTPPLQAEPGTLPSPVIWLMNDITTTLSLSFPKYPPHTIQRLAELVIHPTQHYRSLPTYLHALDRIVHVTSGNNLYPLPPAVADMSSMTPHTRLTNGAPDSPDSTGPLNGPADASAALNVGSDEALGGALLTPIPWLHPSRIDSSSRDSDSEGDGTLTSPIETDSSSSAAIHTPTSEAGAAGPSVDASSTSPTDSAAQAQQLRHSRRMEGQVRTESTETIEGPNGMGSIETVSVSVNGIPSHGAANTAAAAAALAASLRGVTQGELLRQEQRAGVVPLSQLNRPVLTPTGGQPTPSEPTEPGASASKPDEDTPTSEAASSDTLDAPSTPPAKPDTDEDGDAAMGSDGGDPDEEALSSPTSAQHARGPDEIGPADTGPQTVAGAAAIGSGGTEVILDIEAAVGRKAEPMDVDPEAKTEEKEDKEKEAEEKDDEKGEDVTEKADETNSTSKESTPKRELPEAEESDVPAKKLKGDAEGET